MGHIKLPNTPRTKDGSPNLNAPAPRVRDGKIDFSGIWYEDPARTDPNASPEGQTIGEDRLLILVPADGSPLPLLPAAAAAVELRVTVDDPKTFTKTWTSKPLWFKLLPDTEFIENICDNEKDVERIKAAR